MQDYPVGSRVKFRDLSGRLVSDTVRGHTKKTISYAAYHENHPVIIDALLLDHYSWVPVDEVENG
jgi:hypothetical protein